MFTRRKTFKGERLMWNKKMIKNAGAVAVILVCILIATGILGYGIKKMRVRHYLI